MNAQGIDIVDLHSQERTKDDGEISHRNADLAFPTFARSRKALLRWGWRWFARKSVQCGSLGKKSMPSQWEWFIQPRTHIGIGTAKRGYFTDGARDKYREPCVLSDSVKELSILTAFFSRVLVQHKHGHEG